MANQIAMVVVILVFGITTGTMALVARARGAGNAAAASQILRQSLLLAPLQSTVIGPAGAALAPWLLRALGADGAVAQAGTLYLRIMFLTLRWYRRTGVGWPGRRALEEVFDTYGATGRTTPVR
ncbi:MAG TPA: MATE family efflux transporter [Longimicrobium sp.]|jgi:Na+-driven multidrug efflux pump|uniref:MATE family efflux transporter n=1 Tax=Longimicrobium sp. TaxID=2029185 RepID=UPI002EDB1150